MPKNKILFIGPLGGGRTPENGASIKNLFLFNRLKSCGYTIKAIDTENWKKKPQIILKVFFYLLLFKEWKVIISTSFKTAYRLISFASRIINPQRIFYWVIGGALSEKIKDNHFSPYIYKKIRLLIVEGNSMKRNLAKLGIDNTVVIPNFKRINHFPIIPDKSNSKTKFVFLSRIIPEKGCDLILEATRILNSEGLGDTYSVTFYGPIDDNYKESFLQKVAQKRNVSYAGFLDLRNWGNYDTLATYDCLLFPTFWATEGFPGIIIDAMIAGLPVIASDWNMNTDLVIEEENGYIINSQDLSSLVNALRNVIQNKNRNLKMRHITQKMASQYDVDKIISPETLAEIGLD